jgi:phosphoribosylanthranilate isomerase
MAARVKICGVTDLESAELAVELGADYLGLNFYPPSPRYLDVERARSLAEAVRGRVVLVGVFVNESPERIAAIVDRVGLDLVQASGDEPPAAVRTEAARTIKAFRGGAWPQPARLAEYGPLWGVLIDAPHSTLFGGSGEAWDYGRLTHADSAGRADGTRLFLAGGLDPDNVRQAVRVVRPYAVDVCSGVERAPGIKDRDRMRRFFEEVRLGQDPTAA